MAETSSYEDLIDFQRKEKKDLLAKIQKMKHSVPKGDKKRKKEVTAEITQMLADCDLKHENQLKEFEACNLSSPLISAKQPDVDSVEPSSKETDTLLSTEKDVETLEGLNAQETSELPNSSQKLSKAQKRRNKKAQQQKEREKAIADQEVDNLTGLRHIESLKINQKLLERGFTVHEIPSDGNCLYKAIEHQLSTLNLKKSTAASLREETSKYLFSHKDEYLPFLTHPDTGDVLSDEQFEKYCDDIVNTPAWGGHVEIKILSCVCEKPIEVIQADGPSVVVGDETVEPKLIISYHRYAYGLGEHYNSVKRLSDSASNGKLSS